MDLVVSVDTSVLHLAGALGKPTLALLPYNRCWRWGRGTEETPFYPSVRLVTQCSPGDWPGVMSVVRAEVDRLIGGQRVPPEPQTDYELLNVPTREF
jgi:ADP-heptose:LPS heptosyltransferase